LITCPAQLFLELGFALEFVEEIEDEGDLGDRRILAGWNPEHDDALAVWVQVKIYRAQTIGKLPRRPEFWLVSMERVARGGIGYDHDLVVVGAIEEFFAVFGPLGYIPACGRNLPLTARSRIRAHIDFEVAVALY
jgi:hypothetical protein